MAASAEATGPDFSAGIPLDDLPGEGTIAGHVGDQPILLSRIDGELFAVSGVCTHYGAALAKGLFVDAVVRCPLHHACFDLKTGAARTAPAFDALAQWCVETENNLVFVRRKLDSRPEPACNPPSADQRVVIVGGGAAGMACAEELRALGHRGNITMLSADADLPYDRPNLSKDYLAGTAPEEWLPLRPFDWFEQNSVDLRLGVEVQQIDSIRGQVRTRLGDELPYDRLLIATGAEPVRLESPGFDRSNVFALRSAADARRIAAAATSSARAVVIGSSFIGMEVAAALRQRGVSVVIVSLERVPFEGVLGEAVGKWLQALHGHNGVRFCLGTVAASFDGQTVRLADGRCVDADFVVVGIGVRPRVELARSAGIPAEGSIRVNEYLETSVPGIFAAGDIAEYPDPISREHVRIEHWVLAQRQGQVAAANMLGLKRAFTAIPFFWTEQFGVAIRYVGHVAAWDEVRVDGIVASGKFVARYFKDGSHRASAGVGRDREVLKDERMFGLVAGRSLGDPAALEQCGLERTKLQVGG